jgi:hypothetical protein
VSKVRAHSREELVHVEALNLLVDVDVVFVEDLRVVEGFEDGLLESVGEVGEFVGRLEAADEGLEALLLAEVPVEEAEVCVRERDSAGNVDGLG